MNKITRLQLFAKHLSTDEFLKFIDNCRNFSKISDLLDELVPNDSMEMASFFLACMFVFSDTPEGFDYWKKIDMRLGGYEVSSTFI